MPGSRAFGFVMFLALGHLLVPQARASECPTYVFTPQTAGSFVVPAGCPYMEVKVWGNGGNVGYSSISRGNGGGGAAVTAVYEVQAGQALVAVVRQNQFGHTQPTINGFATALQVGSATGPELIVAGGGGGGGASNVVSFSQPLPPPHGGAGGGKQGQDGLPALVRVNGQVQQAGPGLGGDQEAGGSGGAGYGVWNAGQVGGRYPCIFQIDPCGRSGYMAGVGGEGTYGGGGGGGAGPTPLSPNNDGGAGGGGGASLVQDLPPAILLVSESLYYGNREQPGNPDDPDRHGAGQGGVASAASTPGRIVVRFSDSAPN